MVKQKKKKEELKGKSKFPVFGIDITGDDDDVRGKKRAEARKKAKEEEKKKRKAKPAVFFGD